MIIYKFGGASVRSAEAIRNAARIVSSCKEDLIVVVSAFGKTTNALEDILNAWYADDDRRFNMLSECRLYHTGILQELFKNPEEPLFGEVSGIFGNLLNKLETKPSGNYDYDYDQLVSTGELLSTKIVSSCFNSLNIHNLWVDSVKWLITDETYREASVNWEQSLKEAGMNFKNGKFRVHVTQGFTGGSAGGKRTTLGREGSDYSAAILAHLLDASQVVVWKDVPGILTADPKLFSGYEMLPELSYKDAIELSFFGAKVIHPKTIKPLQNKNIPLYVKSFSNPGGPGTLIHETSDPGLTKPVYIIKKNQLLISLMPKDFSFVVEGTLSGIFASFFRHRIKVNLIQNSAINFSLCIDNPGKMIFELMDQLKPGFRILYNESLDLVTIRHYNDDAVEKMTRDREVLLEQRTRNTIRFVLR